MDVSLGVIREFATADRVLKTLRVAIAEKSGWLRQVELSLDISIEDLDPAIDGVTDLHLALIEARAAYDRLTVRLQELAVKQAKLSKELGICGPE